MQAQRRSVLKKIWNAVGWCFRVLAKLISALFLVSFVISLAIMVWIFRDTSRPPEVLPDTVLVMDLEGLIVDGPPVDVTTQRLLGERIQTVQELVRTLRKAAHDDRIIGLLLKPEAYSMNLTAALDIREELLAFRQAGKKVFAYVDTLWMGSYLLTSAADRIFMPASGTALVMGLRAEVPFYGGLFEKIGVTPEFVAIGEYKTGPQVYTMDHMSDELREILNEQLDDYYAAYIQHIAEARQVSVLQVRSWIDNGLYTAQAALDAGMIDELVYESRLEERLAQELGLTNQGYETDDASESSDSAPENSADRAEELSVNAEEVSEATPEETPEEDAESPLTTLTASEYALVKIDAHMDAPGLHLNGEKIAVVYANGLIATGKGSPSPAQPSVGSDSMTTLLDSLAENDEIRGIILRIDSGGGSAMASDMIRNSVQEATARKPVVVSMADVAASGGYMIAVPADSIVAYPLTLTGSIGIYGGKFSLEGLSELVGIRVETLQRGRNAGLFSSVSAQTPDEHERFRTYLQQRYTEFVTHVAQDREMTMMTADEIAQGRVWSGAQAAELGLVDTLGGLEAAIATMKEMLDIPEEDDVALVPYPRPGSPLEILRQRFGGLIRGSGLVMGRVPENIRTIHQQLETLLLLQDERAFAWWPARIRMK